MLLVFRGVTAADDPVIVVLGDSLSAGYQLPAEAAWPYLLENHLREQGFNFRVINAGISGDTTAGGLTRVPVLLSKYHPSWLVVELGANDGLRGLSLQQAEQNLAQIIELGQAAGSEVLLVGMRVPLNFGPRYSDSFRKMYLQLAEQYSVALMPFLFVSIYDKPDHFLPDLLHPNRQGQRVLMVDVYNSLVENGLLSTTISASSTNKLTTN
ncbi:MAG: arylesterase [Gammaproteobacteria bacterium]|nr:MAG: arylesterase [Gammaproteobacteria bacterium]RLA13444.1 MAG: arylesterase [Gammaproteobacteria bacterium]RLA15627.1 MAG: arylesterase [Gammaproteobacteria bacterium]